MINALPTGERPRIARTTRLTNASHRPARAKRVGSRKRPTIPIKTTRLDGTAKKPSSFERTKNMSAAPNALISQVWGTALQRASLHCASRGRKKQPRGKVLSVRHHELFRPDGGRSAWDGRQGSTKPERNNIGKVK